MVGVEETRKVMEQYFTSPGEGLHADPDALAEDVVFITMATGEETRGRDAVMAMLDYIYHQAFDATVETRRMVFGDDMAVGEWDFVGVHIGEFAGVPATNKEVRVPLCVAYDIADGLIHQARIYFEIPAFLAQVGAL